MALNLQKHAFTFVILFALIGVAALMVPVSALRGLTGQNFTLFDLFSALPAAFLGPATGVAAVLIAKLAGLLIVPGSQFDAISLLRALLPASAGALFFWSYKNKATSATNWLLLQVLVPLLAILLFVLNPAIFGTAAMAFALYWTIPIIAAFIPSNLFLRSLGATFSQHAVGGVLWLYLVPGAANPAFWLALIPVVAVERFVFASGISLSYLGVNAVLSRIEWIAKSGHVHLASAIGARPAPSPLALRGAPKPSRKFSKR
ncbi:MAG: hypothetical protein KGH63_04830 [Candidatus Micrarchaeota archaeon]|nr:hypothetical protein [Candidatus Micrarchaeota archaeon]